MIKRIRFAVLAVFFLLPASGCFFEDSGPDPRTIPGGSGTAIVAQCWANPNSPMCPIP